MTEKVMPPKGFRIETITIDGRGQAFLSCIPCSWFSYNVSTRFPGLGAGLGSCFSNADMVSLHAVMEIHKCPPEVENYEPRQK